MLPVNVKSTTIMDEEECEDYDTDYSEVGLDEALTTVRHDNL